MPRPGCQPHACLGGSTPPPVGPNYHLCAHPALSPDLQQIGTGADNLARIASNPAVSFWRIAGLAGLIL